ncbi:conserved hypothetical protein [Burkholderia pseudomallei Pakistan 9]|uniref:Uncharacterized protein n=1 Tax=Burkholderia pseudomallei 1710a TaxID=320371 RepID=A0A0E1VY09_BURPE|nr:conserved hypothetical protein [Burkholderia pseudomallei Pakistan 9]EEP51720.1 conserved hypothetical protein [Burkholderia pseudomallei MSHR346]EET05044.1 hypothetical protein BURPS1710A_A2624 [Burkholderia pseudomallei 1710a]
MPPGRSRAGRTRSRDARHCRAHAPPGDARASRAAMNAVRQSGGQALVKSL